MRKYLIALAVALSTLGVFGTAASAREASICHSGCVGYLDVAVNPSAVSGIMWVYTATGSSPTAAHWFCDPRYAGQANTDCVAVTGGLGPGNYSLLQWNAAAGVTTVFQFGGSNYGTYEGYFTSPPWPI